MDPLTQGLLGAATAQACLPAKPGWRTWLYGGLGAMAPDLDVLIRSAEDPLIAWEYHRHFTHALAFIPVGGLVAALPFLPLQRRHWQRLLAATTIGYATHGLLDAFTSYGTLLGWPFDRARIAWSWISVIDPIYTLVLAISVVLTARRNDKRFAWAGLLTSSLYLGLGGLQHHRAQTAVLQLARDRGDPLNRSQVFPSLASNRTWRGLYESEGQIHVADVATPWFSATEAEHAGMRPRVEQADLSAHVRGDPAALEAFTTFAWFASQWVARPPHRPEVLGDFRYAATPGGLTPLWGITLQPGHNPAVKRVSFRDEARRTLLDRWMKWTGSDE